MPHFHYKAARNNGEIETGVIEAATQQAAVDQLLSRQQYPLQLRESTDTATRPVLYSRRRLARRLSGQDVLQLTQQWASLLRAGLNLDRMLHVSRQLSEKPAQQRMLERLRQGLRQGKNFSEVLRGEDSTFPGYYLSMIAAGELSGALPEMLDRLVALLARSQAVRERITSAMIYPLILLAMIGFTLTMVIGFVLPRFQSLFEDAGARLPLATRIVIAGGDLLRNYGGWLVLTLTVLASVAMHFARNPRVRLRYDAWLLRRRVLGHLIVLAESARFSRTLGTLLNGGLPLSAALRTAREALSNRALQQQVEQMATRIREGNSLAGELQKTSDFPVLLKQMVVVGEETGQLDAVLLGSAQALDERLQLSIDRSVAILIPIVTVLMGALVAALIGSVLIGILSLNDLAQ